MVPRSRRSRSNSVAVGGLGACQGAQRALACQDRAASDGVPGHETPRGTRPNSGSSAASGAEAGCAHVGRGDESSGDCLRCDAPCVQEVWARRRCSASGGSDHGCRDPGRGNAGPNRCASSRSAIMPRGRKSPGGFWNDRPAPRGAEQALAQAACQLRCRPQSRRSGGLGPRPTAHRGAWGPPPGHLARDQDLPRQSPLIKGRPNGNLPLGPQAGGVGGGCWSPLSPGPLLHHPSGRQVASLKPP
jgi:hypothetical protein